MASTMKKSIVIFNVITLFSAITLAFITFFLVVELATEYAFANSVLYAFLAALGATAINTVISLGLRKRAKWAFLLGMLEMAVYILNFSYQICEALISNGFDVTEGNYPIPLLIFAIYVACVLREEWAQLQKI